MSSEDTITVGFPIYNGSTLLDFAGATQVFAKWAGGFNPVWLAPTTDPIETTEQVKVMPGRCFDDPGPIDILFVPGGGPEVAKVMQDPIYVDFVREAGRQARYYAGAVCTGAFILAAAGLLDGCEATTYWSQHENLALFPNISVVPGYPRWQFSGNRFTGGGISSSIDLALELVNRLAGAEKCQQAQLSVQYAPHPPFHSGDPSEAPPAITASVLKGQQPFIKAIRDATLAVIGKG
jgi:cyclohexyl-isocyanide hydratase